jgi:hypothetical protein
MRLKLTILFILCLHVFTSQAQSDCDFLNDTLSLPEQDKVLEGRSLETTLKNLSTIKIFQPSDPRDEQLYLKIVVTRNFYFDKIDNLELKSGSKSYWVKPPSKQYKINKTTGLFVVAVSRNYIVTLKDEGITAMVFGGAETRFTRQDAGQVKKMARCFYDTIYKKK